MAKEVPNMGGRGSLKNVEIKKIDKQSWVCFKKNFFTKAFPGNPNKKNDRKIILLDEYQNDSASMELMEFYDDHQPERIMEITYFK